MFQPMIHSVMISRGVRGVGNFFGQTTRLFLFVNDAEASYVLYNS